MRLKWILSCVWAMHCNLFLATHAQQQALGCAPPVSPLNGNFRLMNGGTKEGDQVVFRCDDGYSISGMTPATCTCNEYGCSWNYPPPTCGRARSGPECAAPQRPINGYISQQDGDFPGAEVHYGCYADHRLQGQEIARCVCDEFRCDWNSLPPTCQPVSDDDPNEGVPDDEDTDEVEVEESEFNCPVTTRGIGNCDNPGTPTNGCSRHISVKFGNDKIRFWCRPGYRLVGRRHYTCNIFGDGSSLPRCEVDGCPLDPVSNGQLDPTKTIFRNGDTVTYRCDTGYMVSGPATKRCDNNRWNRVDRTFCIPVPCGDPGRPNNGRRVGGGGTSFRAVANYRCNAGYKMVGSGSRTCQANRQWSGQLPQCNIISCGNPGAPRNGGVVQETWRHQSYNYGSALEFWCDRKYRLVGAGRITCLATERWSEDLPVCEAITCPMENVGRYLNFVDSEFSVDGGYLVDASLDFRCDAGYRLQGASSIVCQQSGRWTYRFPSCEIVRCGAAAAPSHGQMVGSSFTFRSVVVFSCDEGYNIRGPSHLQCQANGRWNGTLPACMEKGCGALESPNNGRVQALGVGVGSKSVFSCDDGYDLIGESVVTCNGQNWDNPPPRCREIRCPVPTRILNGEIVGDDFGIGDEITFVCDKNYNLVGSETSTCNSAGRWSHANPICQAVECRTPENPTHGTTEVVSLEEGSMAKYKCFRGYVLTGSSSARCMPDQTWNNPVPTCTPCPIGTYKDDTTETDCQKCPDSSSTATMASTSRFQCMCQGDTTGPAGGPCNVAECEIPAAPDNGVIADCVTNQNGRCYVECSPGYVVRGSRVRTCLDNQWLPRDNIVTCHACPEDTYSTGGSRTSCQLCPARSHTQGAVGATSIDSCICLPGYRRYYENGPCQDINECEVNNGGCTGPGAECHNTDGSYSCRCSIPGSALDSTGKYCTIEQSCEDLTERPKNGQLRCIENDAHNSKICHIICDDGFFFVSGNNYVTCGPTSNWTYSHQARNRTAELPACMEEFFIDTLFNLTTTIEVPSSCDSYTDNLPADYNINSVLQEKGECSAYRCSVGPDEVSMQCTDTGTGVSQLRLQFNVYLENPEDGQLTPDCERTCQFEHLRDMIKATGRIWLHTQSVFKGDIGQVETDSGASITLTGGEVVASRPDVRCHEQGRVFTERKMCVPCPVGYFLANRKAHRCSPCPVGTYQDQKGQISCNFCRDGLTTLAAGAFSAEMCITQDRVDTIVAGIPDDTVLVST